MLSARTEKLDQQSTSGLSNQLCMPKLTWYDQTHPMPPDIARQVGALVGRVYPKDRERYQGGGLISQAISDGAWIAFLVVNSSGKVCAHAALLPRYAERMVESSRVMVDPGERNKGYSRMLVEAGHRYLEEVALQHFDQIYAEPVTIALWSQRNYKVEDGYRVNGLLPFKFYDAFMVGERTSVVSVTRIVNPNLQMMQTVYVPEKYRKLAGHVYDQLNCIRTISSETPNGRLSSNLAEYAKDPIRCVSEEVKSLDTVHLACAAHAKPSDIIDSTDEKFKKGAKHISVELEIAFPTALRQIEALTQAGFFFGSISPRGNGDVLVMQRFAEGSIKMAKHLQLLQESGAQLFYGLLMEAI